MNPLGAFVLRLQELGPWAPVLYVAVYIVASVALIPGSLLTLTAGAVFGLWPGVPLAFTGAVLGSSAAFGVARRLAGERVSRWLGRDPRVSAVSRAVADQGLKVVFLLRLSPVVPYNVLNYALGLSEIRFRDYLLGTTGMVPALFLYTYYGKVVGDVAALAAGTSPPRGMEYYVLLGVGLAATIAVTIVITRAARAALVLPRDP